MDIKFNIKGLSIVRGHVKIEDLDVGISLSEDETLNSNECVLELLDSPAVQELIKKFTNEVSFKPLDREPAQQKTKSDIVAELDKHLNSVFSQVKQELDADRRARDASTHILEKLMSRAEKLAERNKF